MKRILIVDDNKDIVDMMKEYLEKKGYEVTGVIDSTEFPIAIAKEKFHLIILDIAMPDMDGYEVCERLKANEETAKIPIMLLTGKELEPDGIAQRCLDLGAESHLLKSVGTEVILGKIQELIGS